MRRADKGVRTMEEEGENRNGCTEAEKGQVVRVWSSVKVAESETGEKVPGLAMERTFEVELPPTGCKSA